MRDEYSPKTTLPFLNLKAKVPVIQEIYKFTYISILNYKITGGQISRITCEILSTCIHLQWLYGLNNNTNQKRTGNKRLSPATVPRNVSG